MADENNQPAPAKPKTSPLPMLFALLNILFMGAGGYYIFTHTLGYVPPNAKEEQLARDLASFRKSLNQEPMLYSMKTFTTNLNESSRRTLRMELTLEMLDAEGFEEVFQVDAKARDAITKLLNGKAYGEVETVQGKLQLKNEIIGQVNGFLDLGVVRNVYFTEFIVQ